LAVTALAPLPAQTFLYAPASRTPDVNELGHWNDVPMMRASARVQQLYSATEVGASSFTARELALRYDGPIPRVGAPGPFTIQRLRIQVGATAVVRPGSVFAQNLTQPLTTVFDQTVSFLPDPGSATPDAWGGPQGGLRFPFSTPVNVAIPAGGWFVVDLSVDGNNLPQQGFAHALLDGTTENGGPADGSASSSGLGCAVGPAALPASIDTSGVHAPGAVHSIHGADLGANAPVFLVIGASDSFSGLGTLPFGVPFTNCNVYASLDIVTQTTADANGMVPAFAPGTLIPVPADLAFQNVTLYEQLISVVPDANQPWNLVLSDKRTVTLGTLTDPSIGVWLASNKDSASASIADTLRTFGFAARIGI
jgi:hypothetical protein